MSRTLTISEELHDRLQHAIRRHGLDSPNALIEYWLLNEDEAQRREEAVQRIDELRERLTGSYGPMAESVDLVREDRGRS